MEMQARADPYGIAGGGVTNLNADGAMAPLMANSAVSILNEYNKNRQIDVNSLMTAFDDYVDEAKAGLSGVPINFFIRRLDSPTICKAWLNKFSPQRNWQDSSGDDESTGVKTKDS